MEYEKEFIQEQQYLDKTCTFIRENLQREEQACSDEKEQIISARKEMWENVSFRGGFDNAVEAHQALESIQAQSGRYDAAHKRIDHYRQALDSPYFARIDFTEQPRGLPLFCVNTSQCSCISPVTRLGLWVMSFYLKTKNRITRATAMTTMIKSRNWSRCCLRRLLDETKIVFPCFGVSR